MENTGLRDLINRQLDTPGLSRVGLLGPGRMGKPMAFNLLKAGYRLTVWSRDQAKAADLAEAGAIVVPDPWALSRNADVIISMLQDLHQLEPLLAGENGLLDGVDRPKTLVISSTVTPDEVRDLASRVGEATAYRLSVLDAPVSGGPLGAEAGKLAIMLGGATADLEPARTILGACGTVAYCGPLGSGQVTKACNQMVVAMTTAALAEAALLAEAAGVDVPVMFDCLSRGWGASAVLDAKRQAMETHDYRPAGVARFMVKDLHSALGEAARWGARLPLTSLASSLYEELVAAGLGDEDLAVIHRYLGERPAAV